jgi:hypothetical protein
MSSNTPAPGQLGFLTVLQEAGSYVGGYLVTTAWGRPLEFRLSTAVQPNRIQQILYGGTLEDYLCGELIGRALIEKSSTPTQVILTDTRPALAVRNRVEMPVVLVAPASAPDEGEGAAPPGTLLVRPGREGRGPVYCSAASPYDLPTLRDLLHALDGRLDLSEPFARIREAVNEARRMGVAARAA